MFKVVDLKPLDEGSCNLSNSSLSLIKQVEKNVSKLSLNEALMEETPKGELDSMEAFNTSFVIYKITVKSQLIVVSQSSRVRSPDGRSRPSPDELCFAGVGGLKKQKQLLRELVLHPLSTQVHHKGESVRLIPEPLWMFQLGQTWDMHGTDKRDGVGLVVEVLFQRVYAILRVFKEL